MKKLIKKELKKPKEVSLNALFRIKLEHDRCAQREKLWKYMWRVWTGKTGHGYYNGKEKLRELEEQLGLRE